MNAAPAKAAVARAAAILKAHPALLSFLFVTIAVVSMWAMNREKPFVFDDVSPTAVAALAANPCGPEPKFTVLRTTLTRELREEGAIAQVTIDRVEKYLRHGVVERREQWFHKNKSAPVFEIRSFTACGLLSLDYHERSPLPIFGRLMKETGWKREKITGLEVHEHHDFPFSRGGVMAYTKTTVADLNTDTGLRETASKPTRCVVVERTDAARLNRKLTGDAQHVTCTSERLVKTTGGIPAKEKDEKIERSSVYYFVEQLGWMVQVREAEGDSRSFSKLVDFSIE
jgi:hypothetical protein